MIVLEDAEPFDEVRRDFAVEAVELGIPFHITLLFPFTPREQLTAGLLAELRAFFAARRGFEFELARVAEWPGVVYAVPEPDTALRDCMQALFLRFPQWPPYGGVHPEVIPHATLGEEVDAPSVRAEIERRLAGHLPRRYKVDAGTLLEEFARREWRVRERFPFAG